MEITTRKIGNSVGTIFPKEVAPNVGEKYNVYTIGETLIFKPKRKNGIFDNDADWVGFRDSISEEDTEWDTMSSEGKEL